MPADLSEPSRDLHRNCQQAAQDLADKDCFCRDKQILVATLIQNIEGQKKRLAHVCSDLLYLPDLLLDQHAVDLGLLVRAFGRAIGAGKHAVLYRFLGR